MDSQAIDCSGGTAFILSLSITINLPKFAISAFGLEPPWKNDSFCWLEDPLQIDGTSRCYRFGSRDLPEFDRRQVINHRANATRIFSSGESLKGFLLGYGFDSIPEQFRQGTMIPAFVIIYNQFGHEPAPRSSCKLFGTSRDREFCGRAACSITRIRSRPVTMAYRTREYKENLM